MKGPGCSLTQICALTAVAVVLSWAAGPAAATAASPIGAICSVTGLVSGIAGKACSLAQRAGHALSSGKKLVTGRAGSAASAVAGAGSDVAATLGLAAIVTWTTGGAKYALDETAKLISAGSRPQLQSPWFSRVYWRMSAIAVLLTVPFLLAAAVQALLRSDLALLVRCAFGYLPLSMLAVGVAAQLTTMLLSLTDTLCGLVSAAAGNLAPSFLIRAGGAMAVLTAGPRSPFLAFVLAVFTVAGAIVLWLELMMRDAAVYVIVVTLPLAFAAMVWPARRVWALRAVELLVALILAKLAMVTVLTLGGAALMHSATATGWLVGLVLLLLGVFSPWAMLRLVPLTELASGAAGRLRADTGPAVNALGRGLNVGVAGHLWASDLTAGMRSEAEQGAAADAVAAEGQVAALRTASGGPGAEDESGGPGAADEPGGPAPGDEPGGPGDGPLRGPGDGGSGPSPAPGGDLPSGRRLDGGSGSDQDPPGEVALGREPEELGDAEAAVGAPSPPRERVPGLPPEFQAEDWARAPLVLGRSEGWPPPGVWEPVPGMPGSGSGESAPLPAVPPPGSAESSPGDEASS
jgi:hypothetical protein